MQYCNSIAIHFLNTRWMTLSVNLLTTRALCKVRGLTLLLQVGTFWRCGDGLFFQIPPLASDALLTTLSLLENVLQTVDHFEISCLGAPFPWLEKQKSHGTTYESNSVFGLEKVDRWNPIKTSAIQSGSRPMRFLGFSNHEKGAPKQEISKWSTVCSTFSRRRWSVVSASLAKGGTSKKRPSLHLHKDPTRSNKASLRTVQTALAKLKERINSNSRWCIWIAFGWSYVWIPRSAKPSSLPTTTLTCSVYRWQFWN
jgi:hypothetical protein